MYTSHSKRVWQVILLFFISFSLYYLVFASVIQEINTSIFFHWDLSLCLSLSPSISVRSSHYRVCRYSHYGYRVDINHLNLNNVLKLIVYCVCMKFSDFMSYRNANGKSSIELERKNKNNLIEHFWNSRTFNVHCCSFNSQICSKD